ncbi:hypothetical protein AB0G02_16110 [Actinosynnema sp. NPDC023658]|uniref:hypothetical protein n=1 Tax=Actinosynnema sp. NPDC023658 TaxID=3155465 RepID=UPI0033EF512B
MNARRLEVVLPADVSSHDYVTVAHAIWAVLDAAGLDEGSAVRTDAEFADVEEDARVD